MAKRKTKIIILILVVALSLTIWLKPIIIKHPIQGLFNSDTLRYRMWAWQIALRGWWDRPILGYGLNNYQIIFNKYFNPEFQETESSVIWYDHAHNFYLDLLCETGLLGFSAFALVLYFLFKKLRDLPRKERTILTAVFVAYFTHLFFIFPTISGFLIFLTLIAYVSVYKKKTD